MTDFSRRGMLAGLGALMAVAVAPKTLAPLAKSEQDIAIEEAMRTGIVRNQVFLIRETLDLRHLEARVIGNIFRAAPELPAGHAMLAIGRNGFIVDNQFFTNGRCVALSFPEGSLTHLGQSITAI